MPGTGVIPHRVKSGSLQTGSPRYLKLRSTICWRYAVEEFLNELTEQGFDPPVRSVYFFWIDRYIIDNKWITKEILNDFVKKMVDGKFIHNCGIYDFPEEQYLLVCKFTLNLYEIVFFLPDREGYLSGKKYFMRIKGKLDLVSLRRLFKIFYINVRR
jgi:hypothetical protein